jgi:hypothetical protein
MEIPLWADISWGRLASEAQREQWKLSVSADNSVAVRTSTTLELFEFQNIPKYFPYICIYYLLGQLGGGRAKK